MERTETPSAIVERVNPQLVITRYKPGIKANSAAVRENMVARMAFPGKEPYAVIGIFPADVDFDMTLLEQNHYTNIALNKVTQVLAIVAEGELFDPIARLYFAYHPTSFASQVFPTEAAAMAWVNKHIKVLMEQAD